MRKIIFLIFITLTNFHQVLAQDIKEDVVLKLSRVWSESIPINISENVIVLSKWAEQSKKRAVIDSVSNFEEYVPKVTEKFSHYNKSPSALTEKTVIESIESLCNAYKDMDNKIGGFPPAKITIAKTEIYQPIVYMVKRLKDSDKQIDCRLGWNQWD